MLYGNESISTYTRGNVIIWMVLAFQGGVLNVGGFLACGRFVSHVTGFATYFGVAVNRNDFIGAFGMLLTPIFFLLGAFTSGLLVDVRLSLHKRPKYYIIFGILFLLILFVVVTGFNGLYGQFGAPLNLQDHILLALLCLICGMQNALVTTVSKSIVRTTHLTGLTTDLGIGLARVLNRRKIREPMTDEVRANLMRIGIIIFFGLGSAVGAYIFLHIGYRGFLLPTIVSGGLFAATLYFDRSRPTKAAA